MEPGSAELRLRWRTTPEIARDANTVGVTVFGGDRADDDVLAQRAAANRDTLAAGTGGVVVAYFGGAPVALAGIRLAGGVARLWGGAVLEAYRGRGVYRALVAGRLSYAAERGATMALTRGRVTTSSPILRRVGFVSYGRERTYRLPLT
ncbi:GNAT family N-acetyltransferase [Actinoplanes sp. NPDC051411]|uniref:GNAT family N-acetyltransferase n=1 Tax=Actinoplanes sp. NPDC051411 TaxID=3155522 RepID=UPI00343FE001